MSEKPIRIAMIGGRGIPATHGGVERAVHELSVRLAGRGHHVTVFCRNPYCETRPPEFEGVRLRYLPCIDTKHLEAFSHTFLATLLSAWSPKYDIFHYHATGPSLFSFWPRLWGRKVIGTVQGLDYKREKWGAGARAFLKTCAWAAGTFPKKTIVVSKTLQAHYRDVHRKETLYIPNGVPPVEDSPLPPDNAFGLVPGKYVLFLSRIVQEKGCHTLIEAFRGLETDYQLAICGGALHEDTYVERLKNLAGDDPRIRFLGPVYAEDKERIFSSAAVYVHPSSIEGLPISLLEAMSHGRCVLVSDISENVEVLGDPPSAGETFRQGNAQALREKLAELLASPERRNELGRAARERVRTEYDWETITDRTVEVYRQVMG